MLVPTYLVVIFLLSHSSVKPVEAGWPTEIADIPANDFYDCLYIFYICTDAVDDWPKNKNICTRLFNECEANIQIPQSEDGILKPLSTTTESDKVVVTTAATTTTTAAQTTAQQTTASTSAPTTTVTTTTEPTTTTTTTTTEAPTTTTTTTQSTTSIDDSIEITEPSTTEEPDNESSSTLANIPIKVTSCLDLREEGIRKSGIYDIQFGDETRKVFCDMNTLGGGWTVIQRRGDFGNPPDFFLRNWTEYRNGFGRPDRELWLGLEYMFLLSNVETVQMLINLEDFDGNRTAILVNEFRIANEDSGYRIFYKNFSSPLGRSLPAKGTKFSTVDRDNDAWSKNCAERFSGAWWYSACHNSNLNGLYLRGEHESFGDGVNWYHWKGYHYSLKLTVLKIRGVRPKKK